MDRGGYKMKEYKIIDCERSHLIDFINSDIKYGWELFQVIYTEKDTNRDGDVYRMYTIIYSREKKEEK